MRATFPPEVERARIVMGNGPWSSRPGDDFGAFLLRRESVRLKVIASSGSDEIPWDHVSVSTEVRCPTWAEMSWVKSLFFEEEEIAVEYHPPKSQYVNYHPFCLHLWRPHGEALPLPPTIALGPVGQAPSPDGEKR